MSDSGMEPEWTYRGEAAEMAQRLGVEFCLRVMGNDLESLTSRWTKRADEYLPPPPWVGPGDKPDRYWEVAVWMGNSNLGATGWTQLEALRNAVMARHLEWQAWGPR